MKIGIDLSCINESMAGIAYYTFELARKIQQIDTHNSYVGYTYSYKQAELFKDFFNMEIKVMEARRPNFKWIVKVSSDLKKNKIDLFISTANFSFGIIFPNTIQILHDIIPIKYPQFWPKKASIFYKYQLKLEAKRAKYFATNSLTTLRDLNKYCPVTKKKSRSIGSGLNAWVFKTPTEQDNTEVKDRLGLPDKYLLSVGTIQPRKNYVNIIKAFARLSRNYPDYHYIIVGQKGWFYEEVFDEVKTQALIPKIKFLGYTEENDLNSIYRMAKGFVSMSYYEGAALPCLEAYATGLNVLTSNIDVMKEIMKNNALYADPFNVSEIATQMEALINLPEKIPNQQFLEEYSYTKVAERLISIIKEHY